MNDEGLGQWESGIEFYVGSLLVVYQSSGKGQTLKLDTEKYESQGRTEAGEMNLGHTYTYVSVQVHTHVCLCMGVSCIRFQGPEIR